MDRTAASTALLDHCAALDDPRQQAKVLYHYSAKFRVVGSTRCAAGSAASAARFW